MQIKINIHILRLEKYYSILITSKIQKIATFQPSCQFSSDFKQILDLGYFYIARQNQRADLTLNPWGVGGGISLDSGKSLFLPISPLVGTFFRHTKIYKFLLTKICGEAPSPLIISFFLPVCRWCHTRRRFCT